MTQKKPMAGSLKTFLFALGVATLIFLPFVIMDRGYFIYYGDFNVQQIPFYKLAHEAVRSGDIFWSWYTDLGANFIGSYSFYLLFSPFFWLTLPFPTAFLPHLMVPLLVLKTACAATTAYLFLRRFVRDGNWAVLGGMLYAFSGWMDFNIFFNHFHEVAVFFPLLLWSLELLVCENRKGLFAAMVAVNAAVNYWFFVGEVVFVVLYVIVRAASDREWGLNLRKFVRIGFESVLGVLCAGVVLLPSVLALMGNPRTGTSELLTGWNFWLYWHEQYYMAIPHSLFFPPDLPARPNFFPDRGARWSSLSAWLPLLGMSGVLAYFFDRKKDWLKRILVISFIFAMVPGFNSLFILLNHSYYARWFYMPVLLMALCTIRALEDSERTTEHFSRALKWCLWISVAFIVICGLTPTFVDGKLSMGLSGYPDVMWIWSFLTLVCLLVVTVLLVRLRHHRWFQRLVCGCVALVSVGFGILYISTGKNDRERSDFIIDSVIEGRYKISVPSEPFGRSDVYNTGVDNHLMFWHLPNIQAFHSIVPVSIMEFYPEVGVTRDVGSRPEIEFWALRPLLSVRWLFIQDSQGDQQPMPGYRLWGNQIGYNIYENENYLPMGYAYSDFLLREELEEFVDTNQRSNLMLRAVVLEDWDAVDRNSDLMAWLDPEDMLDFSYEAMVDDVDARRRTTCYDFSFDTRGFTARSNLDEETLMFFSVPYERGWSARVNGQEALIEKVNIGFMAVRVPAGESEIRFDYFTPGLLEGLAVTGGAVVILIVYVLLTRRRKDAREEREELNVQRALFAGETLNLTWEEYLQQYRDRKGRASRLQQVLNEGSARHIGEELDEAERTLPFTPPAEDETPSAEPPPPEAPAATGGEAPPAPTEDDASDKPQDEGE